MLIAYGCEPGRGSEQGTGWNMALGLASTHDITVVTRANNKDPIEAFLKVYQGPRPEFVFIDPPQWTIRLKKSGILPIQVFYAFWQRAVARHFQAAGRCHFDIVHQITFNSFELPPLAFTRSQAIKVWGPVGGGQTAPLSLLSSFSRGDAIKERFRSLRVRLSAQNPFCRRILRSCSLVLFANEETRELLQQYCPALTGMMIDVGVNVASFKQKLAKVTDSATTIMFAGKLDPRKGALLLVEAFELLSASHSEVTLRIVGDGPLRAELEHEAAQRGLGARVVFTGVVDHAQMVDELEQADIFVFQSIRDTSGAIVLEAMAMMLPIVCLDHQGAALMVADDCGLKIPVGTKEQTVAKMADALRSLVDHQELRESMGKAGRIRATDEFDWSSKVNRISAYYEDLTSKSQAPPRADG